MTQLRSWQVVKRGHNAAAWNGSLHVRSDAAARRNQRLELVTDTHERVGHADDNFASQCFCVLLRGGGRRIPGSGDDDNVAIGRGSVVAVGQAGRKVWPLLDQTVTRLHRPVLRTRPNDGVVANRCEPRREGAAGGAGSSKNANTHPVSLAHRLLAVTVAAMGLLTGKNIVITGVLTDASLAYGVALLAQQEGANIVLTGAGRALSLTQRTGRKLPQPVDVFELDVTNPEHLVAVRNALAEKWGRVDGVLHSIGFAPEACLGEDFLAPQWADVAVALHVSAYSLKALAEAFVPLMSSGGAFVGLDFDNTVAWPAYNWMGVAKSALESVSRYLARELGPQGIRSNLVAAGPVKTMAAKSIPGFKKFEDIWDDRAPLGWDVTDSTAVAKACVALLSDWFPATTGEVVHVDGGYHAVGA